MIELALVHESGGRFRCADKASHDVAIDKLIEGQLVRAKIYKQRSIDQHRWFFVMVEDAFHNQRAGPAFSSSEELRKWLLIRAGWCHAMTFEPEAMTVDVARWLRVKYGLDFTHNGKNIICREAKSISFKDCDGDQMTAIADKVIDIICDQIVPGTTRSDWEPYKHAR